ncbi:hypothetical protein V1478_001578 [Vespula squamosa]|uniref:Uncharacterized protein n=1 Tax=Vespula squamosa TaxID=30214 RepID=A0ABD2C1V2_VESSQ
MFVSRSVLFKFMVYETILFFTFVSNVTQGTLNRFFNQTLFLYHYEIIDLLGYIPPIHLNFEKREIGTRVFSLVEEKNRILLCPVKLLSVAVKKDRKQENLERIRNSNQKVFGKQQRPRGNSEIRAKSRAPSIFLGR